MQIGNNKEKGRAGLSLAIAYFGTNGYTVSLPINDTQWYDLVVEKNGIFQTVQCKFTASKDKAINFRSTGGTNGGVYDSILNHPLDLLFCADDDMNLFLIPVEDIKKSGNVNSIKLRTERSIYSSTKSFDTSNYLVQI